MKKFLLLIWLSLEAAFSVASEGQYSESYLYVELESRSTIQLDVGNRGIVVDGHTAISASECASEAGLKCIIGGGSYFVFPTETILQKGSWEYEGIVFTVAKLVKGHLWGRDYSASLVKSKQGKDNYWFLFSPKYGLLAMGLHNQQSQSTFVLEGECGFASSTGCQQQ